MAKQVLLFSAKKTVKDTSVSTPKEFGEKVNKELLAQAIHVYRDRRHPGLSKTQTRGEVSLTTAKMYRQKGTGNARHGAASAPIFVGGGKAHGPKGVKRELVLPRKMRQKALKIAWSAKQALDKVVLVSDLDAIKSTKDAQLLVDKVVKGKGTDGWRKITLFLADQHSSNYRYFKNLPNVVTEKYSNANAYSVYFGGLIAVDHDVLQKEKPAKKTVTKKKEK